MLERAHRAVVAVIESDLERRGAAAHAWRDAAVHRFHQAPNLRRDHERFPVHGAQARAETVLRQTETIERRRVEIAQACAIQMRERAADGRIRVLARQAAERCRAHTKQRDRNITPTNTPQRGGIEAHGDRRARQLAML